MLNKTNLVYTPAPNLREALQTLRSRPLLTQEEIDGFYSDAPNEARGGTKVQSLKLEFDEARLDEPYKAFVVGHSGCGKSTELTKLILGLTNFYRVVRFDVQDELDSANSKPFDLMLLLAIKLVETAAKPVEEGGLGLRPSDSSIKSVWEWFEATTTTESQYTLGEFKAMLEMGTPKTSWWDFFLTFSARVSGEAKYAASREEKSVAYRLSRVSDLLDRVNSLVAEYQTKLPQGEQWLFVVEGFDKNFATSQLETFFITYGNLIEDFKTHLIITIPLNFAYSEHSRRLPPLIGKLTMPDMPVYTVDFQPHTGGREAVRSVLRKRINLNLFEDHQCERLIVASGGSLRPLFDMTRFAASNAILRNASKIAQEDVNIAINYAKREFEYALGTSKENPTPTIEEKLKKLLEVYQGDTDIRITDEPLNALVRIGIVQEFNGAWRFGVSPIGVEILGEQFRDEMEPHKIEGKFKGGIE